MAVPVVTGTHSGVAFVISLVVRIFVQIMFFLTGNYCLLRASFIIIELLPSAHAC